LRVVEDLFIANMAFEHPSKSIVALIPARSGSKGIPDKNLTLLGGKHLIGYSIEAATNCAKVDSVVLSSDSERYLEIGAQYGAVKHRRSSKLSGDDVSIQAVASEFVEKIGRPKGYSALLLLLPTYPNRNSSDLEYIIDRFLNLGGHRPLVGLRKAGTHPYRCYYRSECGKIESVLGVNTNEVYRRQQFPEVFDICMWACIVPINRVSSLDALMLSPDTFGLAIPEEIDYVNIDTPADLEAAEKLMESGRFRL